MNKIISSIGIVLVLISGFLFLAVFSGGSPFGFPLLGTDPTSNFAAFLFVIIFLPLGSALAFFGLAYRAPILAAGTQVVYRGSPGVGRAALALAVIAIIIGAGAFAYAYSNMSGASNQINGLQTTISTLNGKISNVATVNLQPTTIAFRVNWCNTDPTGQDRFCPPSIIVPQGYTVQILFETNDTSDAHTFTLLPPGYSFQLNNTYGAPNSSGNFSTAGNGMHNFLTNGYFQASCVNNATFAQQSAGVSSTLCVSGSSLLQGGSPFRVAANPTPASAFSNGSGPISLKVDNSFHFIAMNNSATNPYTGSPGYFATWSIGSFQATQPGVYEFLCHYHVSNGMFGYLIVLPNAYCNTNAQACGLNSTTTTSTST